MNNDSLSHTKWNCKYHIVFAPKYRRQVIYGKIKKDIGAILRKLCEFKGVEIIEANACKDHIHMLVSIPPKIAVSSFMGYLKGKSSLMIFDKHANLKYRYDNRNFWCRGYYVDTVGKNKERIAEYVRNQLQEDIALDQLSLKEYFDPYCYEIGINSYGEKVLKVNYEDVEWKSDYDIVEYWNNIMEIVGEDRYLFTRIGEENNDIEMYGNYGYAYPITKFDYDVDFANPNFIENNKEIVCYV